MVYGRMCEVYHLYETWCGSDRQLQRGGGYQEHLTPITILDKVLEVVWKENT